jgi:hypothetical protein
VTLPNEQREEPPQFIVWFPLQEPGLQTRLG